VIGILYSIHTDARDDDVSAPTGNVISDLTNATEPLLADTPDINPLLEPPVETLEFDNLSCFAVFSSSYAPWTKDVDATSATGVAAFADKDIKKIGKDKIKTFFISFTGKYILLFLFLPLVS